MGTTLIKGLVGALNEIYTMNSRCNCSVESRLHQVVQHWLRSLKPLVLQHTGSVHFTRCTNTHFIITRRRGWPSRAFIHIHTKKVMIKWLRCTTLNTEKPFFLLLALPLLSSRGRKRKSAPLLLRGGRKKSNKRSDSPWTDVERGKNEELLIQCRTHAANPFLKS